MADSSSSLVDPYGFSRPENFDAKVHDEFMSHYLGILARRAKRWQEYMKKHNPPAKSRKLQRFVRKGIPAEFRPLVWLVVSGTSESRKSQPDLYQTMLQGPLDAQLSDAIQTDIPRTFPNNIYFRQNAQDNQASYRALYNVLRATAKCNTRVGYCQGMNFIAAFLLLVVKKEDTTFWLMNALINRILPEYYSDDMIGLRVECEVLRHLVRLRYPTVHRVAEHIGRHVWSMITTRWFICLYIDVLPTETVLRIWDCLFYEGSKILLQVALAIIQCYERAIIRCNNISELMDVFRGTCSSPETTDCHTFMKRVFDDGASVKQSMIDELRQVYQQNIEIENKK